MSGGPLRRSAGVTALLASAVAFLAACSAPIPGATVSVAPSTAGSEGPGGATGSPAPSGGSAGRPYDAAAILDAMADSRRPGGVPDELQSDEVAESVASQLWTFDGRPWAVIAIGGACGPTSCSLDVAGSPEEGGSDLYSFSVAEGGSAATLVDRDLHGYPPELDADLDAVAQAALDAETLKGMALVGAQWMPPPDSGRFLLAYRTGGEEGSPGVDVLLDLTAGEVIEVRPAG